MRVILQQGLVNILSEVARFPLTVDPVFLVHSLNLSTSLYDLLPPHSESKQTPVFHPFFMHMYHIQDFPVTILLAWVFVYLPKYPTPTSHRGIKLKFGSGRRFFFPISMLISSLSLFSQLLGSQMALATPTSQSPSGTRAASEGSETFTYGVDRGGKIMWQLCDDGRGASHRSDTCSGSDLLFATWKSEPSLSRRTLIKQQSGASAFSYYSVQSDLSLQGAECKAAPWKKKKKKKSQIEIKPETQWRLNNSSAILPSASQTVCAC